ncbi:MAG: ribosome maturation factor RimM [Bacteroidales bacterium]
MDTDHCFFLGSVIKPTGLKGNLICFIDADEPLTYSSLESVYIEVKGTLVPYLIEDINQSNKNNQLIVKFEGVDSQEDANNLAGNDLYLPLSLLPKLEGNKFYFHEVMEFDVVDHQKGDIGKIVNILDYPNNPIMEIEHDHKQILVPIKDEIIVKVDRSQKKIFIHAPEGLIDLYLSE